MEKMGKSTQCIFFLFFYIGIYKRGIMMDLISITNYVYELREANKELKEFPIKNFEKTRKLRYETLNNTESWALMP